MKKILLTALLCLPALFFTPLTLAQDFTAAPPLPEFPQEYQTTEYNIRVVQLASGLANPWGMAFLPNGDILITERAGRLRIIRDGMLDPDPIAGVPDVQAAILGGLLGVTLHPDFTNNQTLYLSYSKANEDNSTTTALAKAHFDGQSLSMLEDIFIANTHSNSPTNFGGRMLFDADGYLFMTIGERQEQDRAQDGMDHGGKIVRLNDDGSIPNDNPYVGQDGFLPEIYAIGFRSPQGLAVHPDTGAIWENEHGPLGGDEVNIVLPGRNYGWPLVTYGKDYDGTVISASNSRADLESPYMYWVPSIAISGMSFYTGDRFPLWQGNAFVGSLIMGRTPMTGHIQRITFSDDGDPVTREPILLPLRQRIRDVQSGPDGLLYVLTDQNPGALLRIEPVE